MEDVEVMEDETELLIHLIVDKLISKNSKSFENIPELIETRLTLKTFSKEYRKTRAFAELTSFKKITRKKKLPKITLLVSCFRENFRNIFGFSKHETFRKILPKQKCTELFGFFVSRYAVHFPKITRNPKTVTETHGLN